MKRFMFLLIMSFLMSLSACLFPLNAAESEGIAYYKAGLPEAAKALLLNDLNTQQSAMTCYYLGNIYMEENKPDSASFYYNKGKELEVENPYCLIGLAGIQIKNNLKAGQDLLSDVIKGKNKKNPDILIAAARAYLRNDLIAEAVSYQEMAKKIDGKYAPVYVLAGDIALADKKIGEACSQYEQAVYFDPSCKEAYIRYADAYSKVNPQLSIEMLKKLKTQDSAFLPVERELARLYYSIGEYRNAINSYDRFIDTECASSSDLTKYGMVLFLAKDYDKSLGLVKKGLLREPENLVLKRLAMYDDYELKDYTAGVLAAKDFFTEPENPDYVYLDYLYYGRLLKAVKQANKALAHYEKALELEPDRAEIWKELSDTYEMTNDYEQAIVSFDNYLKALNKEVEVGDLFLLGRLYYFAGSALDPASAIDLTKRNQDLAYADSIFGVVSEKVPDNYLGNFWRARTNSLLDPETADGLAKPYYEAALAILESKPDAGKSLLVECNSYLGYYYFVKNDYSTSKVYWNKILEIDPGNETAQKALAGIK